MTTLTTEAPLDLREVWRQVKLPVIVGVLVLAVAALLAAVESAPPPRALDPRDASPVGARAVAQLLRDRHVAVDAVAPSAAVAAAGPTTTVVVSDPASMSVSTLRALAQTSADIVVIGGLRRELGALGLAADVSGAIDVRTVVPGCGFEPAVVAGAVRISGDLYRPPGSTVACYSVAGSAALLVQPRAGGARTVALGSGTTLTNERLAEEGDAALALGVLDRRPRVAWVIPQPATSPPADQQRKGIVDLLPSRLLWALLQLAVVVGAVALWRGRRLGPVVAEPLPVVVRAAETVQGRARLMRAARLRGRAAEVLRSAARTRIADLLGLGPAPARPALVESVGRRTRRTPSEVDAVLFGPEPADDAALVRLADDLDDLERAVRDS